MPWVGWLKHVGLRPASNDLTIGFNPALNFRDQVRRTGAAVTGSGGEGVGSYREIPEIPWRGGPPPRRRRVVLLIHGYNNTLVEAGEAFRCFEEHLEQYDRAAASDTVRVYWPGDAVSLL